MKRAAREASEGGSSKRVLRSPLRWLQGALLPEGNGPLRAVLPVARRHSYPRHKSPRLTATARSRPGRRDERARVTGTALCLRVRVSPAPGETVGRRRLERLSAHCRVFCSPNQVAEKVASRIAEGFGDTALVMVSHSWALSRFLLPDRLPSVLLLTRSLLV